MALVRVLINDAVKRYLLGAQESEKRLLRKSFEYLESGLWEGGLRIKKLHGASRTVLEARLNRGDRILFTLGQDREEHHGLLVYVWAVVPHDAVERTSRHLAAETAPFLSFEPHETVETVDVDIETLEASCFTQERPEQRAASDSGPQRWFVLDDTEWQRLLLYSKDDFEIFLFLTPEQESLLAKDAPLLVSGTAGSGKTTLSVYYLLRPSLNGKLCLFLTYNRHLRNFCERLYQGLLNQRADRDRIRRARFLTFKDLCLEMAGEARSRFAPEREVDCFSFSRLFNKHRLSDRYDATLVWEEIRSIIKGAKPQISAQNLRRILQQWKSLAQDDELVGELREELLAVRRLGVRDKAEAALAKLVGCGLSEAAAGLEKVLLNQSDPLFRAVQTIASQMEKHEADFSTPLMTLSEYEQMGRKRAPAFVHNRADIYSIAQWYQSRLETERLWDEIDLTRAVIRALDQRSTARPHYDFVCCDEIQDFTDIQLSLLVRLPRHPEMLMLAGDPKQIINPSGFRWEEVRSLFYDRGLRVPEVHALTLNFRCVGSIVALSNVLLKIKQELLGIRSEEKMDEWKFQGRPPFLIEAIPLEVLLESLRVTGADRTIVTRDEAERDFLKQRLGTELVFTIEEAKGLEFRSVLLWKFCRDQAIEDLWSRILRADTAKIHDAAIRHEINLLYVGITRAQQNLILYDGQRSSVIWSDPRIEDLIFRTQSGKELDEVWRPVSTPKQWKKQGDYFFENEHYRAAAECYRNAGALDLMWRASALSCEKRGEWPAAAAFWEELGELERAAGTYERGAEMGKALVLWELLGNTARALECRVRLLESERKYAEAAELWEQMKRFDRAKECWHAAKRPDRLAMLYEREGRLLDAAQCYRECNRFEQAADLYRKAKRPEEAARCLESASRYREAADLWKRLGRTAELLACLQRLNDPLALGEFHESRKAWKESLESYSRAQDSGINQRWEQELAALSVRNNASRALRLTLLGRSSQAAPLWEKTRQYDLAAEQYRAAGSLQDAARCFARAHRWSEAASDYVRDSHDPVKSYQGLHRAINGWLRSNPQSGKSEVEAFADQLRKDQLLIPAMAVYEQIYRFVKAAECAYLKEQPHLVKLYLSRERNVEAAIRFLMDRRLYPEGVMLLEPHLRRGKLDRQLYSLFAALIKDWASTGPEGEERQTVVDLVNGHSSLLPVTLVLSVLEPAGHHDDILYALNNTLSLHGRKEMKESLSLWVSQAKRREASGDMAGAGLRFLILGETRNAYRCWSYVEPAFTNVRCLEEAGHQERVLDFLWQKERFYQGASLAMRHENYARAVDFFKQSGEAGLGGRELESIKRYREALELYRYAGNLRKTAAMLEKLNEFEEAARVWKKAGDLQKRQLCLRKMKSKAIQQNLL